MALYHQLKFPSTFIEYHSVSEWKGMVVISNFDSLEGLQIYRPRQLSSLSRPKFAPDPDLSPFAILTYAVIVPEIY